MKEEKTTGQINSKYLYFELQLFFFSVLPLWNKKYSQVVSKTLLHANMKMDSAWGRGFCWRPFLTSTGSTLSLRSIWKERGASHDPVGGIDPLFNLKFSIKKWRWTPQNKCFKKRFTCMYDMFCDLDDRQISEKFTIAVYGCYFKTR